MSNRAVYKLNQYRWRGGSVECVFVANKADVERLMGEEIYFGEILGKHSEVYFSMTEDNITMVSDNPEVVTIIETYGLESGYDPFEYLDEDSDQYNRVYGLEEETDEEE